MTPPGFDSDVHDAQEEASILMLKVALVLLAEARRRGDFGDEEELQARTAALTDELGSGAPSPDPERALVEIGLLRPDRASMSIATGPSSSSVASVGIDGILFDQGGVTGLRAVPIDREQLSEEELAELDRRRAEWEEQMKRQRQFTGAHFLRAVAAPPQPGASMRIVAVLLYADGLTVDHIAEAVAPPDPDEFDSMEEYFARHRDGEPQIEVEDDLGTEYFKSGGGSSWGGFPVSRGHTGFAPAPPADARTLRITTDSGTVELGLQL